MHLEHACGGNCACTTCHVIVKDGAAVGMVGVCYDVTDRVTIHRELRNRAKQQEAAARIGERALTETDLQKFFDGTVAAIAEILDVDLVKILELVPGKQPVEVGGVQKRFLDTLLVRYQIVNRDSSAHAVGLRSPALFLSGPTVAAASVPVAVRRVFAAVG